MTDREPKHLLEIEQYTESGRGDFHGDDRPVTHCFMERYTSTLNPECAVVCGHLEGCGKLGQALWKGKLVCTCGHDQLSVTAMPGPVGCVLCLVAEGKCFKRYTGKDVHMGQYSHAFGTFRPLHRVHDQPIRESWERMCAKSGVPDGLYCYVPPDPCDGSVPWPLPGELLPCEDVTAQWLDLQLSEDFENKLEIAEELLDRMELSPPERHLLFRWPGGEAVVDREMMP